MRKSLLKSLVGVAVVGATMAITSVAAMAADVEFRANDFYGNVEYGAGKAANTSVTKSPVTVNITDAGASDKYSAFGTYASASNSTGVTFGSEIDFGGARNIEISSTESGTATFYWYDSGEKTVTVGSNAGIDATNKTVTSDSAAIAKNGKITVTTSGSHVIFLGVDFTAGDVSVVEPEPGNEPEDNSFKIANASTGKIDLTDLKGTDRAKYEDGTVIKNYLVTSGENVVYRDNGKSGIYLETGYASSGNLKFQTSEATNVVVSAQTTGNNNISDIAIKDSTGKNVSAVELAFGKVAAEKAGTTGGKITLTAYNLPAGTYEIYSPSSIKVASVGKDSSDKDIEGLNPAGSAITRGIRLYDVTFSRATDVTAKSTLTKIGDSSDYYATYKDVTYLLHPVSTADLTKSTITGPDGAASNEVYTEVKFADGSSVTAAEVGGDYVYGVAITDAGRAPIQKSFTWTLA